MFLVLCFGSIKIFYKYPCMKRSPKKEVATIVWFNILTVRTVKSFFKGI